MIKVRLVPMDSKMYLGRAQGVSGGPWLSLLGLVPFTNPMPASSCQGETYLLWKIAGFHTEGSDT